ncbi:MAG: diguanylate cyclase [Deltaproteobacteria bacterium]|nr:diguanylate cyclase [Deltaproteobacteria bacterium]
MTIKISRNIWARIGVAFTSLVFYALAFNLLYPRLGPSVLALSFIPPALAGWLLGARGGLLSGMFNFPLTAFLLYVAGDTSANNLGGAVLGGSSAILFGGVIGWIKGLLDRLKQQAGELQEERALLQEEVKRRIKAEERLTHEALHDPLTNLPNRRLFVNRLEHAVAWSQRNSDSLCAVLYLDLNRFKSINDSLGHDTGDKILIQVADRLKSSLRAIDTVARMGGDEFAILLEAVSAPEEVITTVQRIQASLALPYEWKGKSIDGGASIGVVMNLTAYEQIDEILRDADSAMYRAKEGGGNEFRVFNDRRP